LITADHYKRGKSSTIKNNPWPAKKTTFNLQPNKKPKSKDKKKKKINLLSHQNILFQTPQKNSQIPMAYTTPPIPPKDSQTTSSMIHVFEG
jgi:hypothetical protein